MSPEMSPETMTVTAGTFMAEVVEASARVPTLVDFWAPWCGPCRQLMPVLDRLAASYGGRFQLAKVNTDEQLELAQQLGIRSLPTVVLFKDRTSVDHFVGLVPEEQIRRMLDKHLPQSSHGPLERAQMLKADGDFSSARAVIANALVAEPGNMALLAEFAELRALEGDVDGARAELARLQGLEPNHANVRRLAALLTFSDVVAANPDVRSLRERASPTSGTLEMRHALAVHQLLGGDVEPALQTWLNIIRTHPGHQDGLAKRSLLQAFELIGEADPIVARTRKEMARLLF